MNKTISINIRGFIFNIEEEAYGTLSKYLEKLKLYLKNSVAGEEILLDVEARIAELFSEILSDNAQVIVAADVDRVIGILGQPEDYEFEDEDFESPSPETNNEQFGNNSGSKTDPVIHRIFRNPDDKIAGGVLGGLAAYFDSDPIWWRLGFVVSIFLGWGTPIPIYIILWIIIPEAKTRAEKLQMKGEPITFDSIKKTIEEEANNLKNNASNSMDKNGTQRIKTAVQEIIQFFLGALESVFKIFKYFFGVACLLFGLGCTIGVVIAAIFGITATHTSFDRHTPFDELFGLFPIDSADSSLILYGGILLSLSLSISLVILAIRILFNHLLPKNKLRIGLIFLVLGFIGFCMLCTGLVRTGLDYRNQEEISHSEIINTQKDTLIIKLKDPGSIITRLSSRKDYNRYGDYKFVDNMVYSESIRFDIQRIDSLKDFEIKMEYYANGSNNQAALKRAQNISYKYTIDSTGTLEFDPYFTFNIKDLIRNQQVDITLFVPIGKSVYLDPSTIKILSDIKNRSDTWDNDMVGFTWTMTSMGLECPIIKKQEY